MDYQQQKYHHKRTKLVRGDQKESYFAMVSDLSKSLSTVYSLPVELKFHGETAIIKIM